MIDRDRIQNNVEAFIKLKNNVTGHFNTNLIKLDKNRFAIDIFIFELKGKSSKQICLTSIYKNGVIQLLFNLGIFSKSIYDTDLLIRKDNNTIGSITIHEIKQLLKWYVNQLPVLQVKIQNLMEEVTMQAQIELFYQQQNLIVNEGFLAYLEKENSEIITDTIHNAYIPFKNGIIKVDKTGTSLLKYNEIADQVVWKKQINQFDILQKTSEEGHFSNFITNVCDNDIARIEALRSGIGYLLHSYNRSSCGQMVILYDEVVTDVNSPQGGTGKGLIANAIKQIKSTVKIDGKKFKGTGTFDFQEIDADTQVLWVDDVDNKFDVDRFNSITTDGFNVERKFKNSMCLPRERSPKILICSNTILACIGPTRKRRQFVIELAPYYSNKIKKGNEEPIVEEHGCRFFSEQWTAKDWNEFHWFMIGCIQLYLNKDLIAFSPKNMIENRLKQSLGSDFYNWINTSKFQPEQDYPTKEQYSEFKSIYHADDEKYTQRKFSDELRTFFVTAGSQIDFTTKSENSKKISYFRIRNY